MIFCLNVYTSNILLYLFELSITVSFPKVILNLTIFRLGVLCHIHALHTHFSSLSWLVLFQPEGFWVWIVVFCHPTPNPPAFRVSSSSHRLLFGCGRWFPYLPHPILCLFAALPSRSDCLLGVNSSFPTSHTQFPAFSRFSLLSPAGFWVWELHFLRSTPNFLSFKL